MKDLKLHMLAAAVAFSLLAAGCARDVEKDAATTTDPVIETTPGTTGEAMVDSANRAGDAIVAGADRAEDKAAEALDSAGDKAKEAAAEMKQNE
jgi:PBP1b-binding outer membrane lipoprotein LpoB